MGSPINHSYFFGEDTRYNWGNRSFFTYYGEFGRPQPWVGGVEAGLLAVVFVVSLVANGCLALVVLRYKELRTVTNYFILNLALADILFAASIPFVAITRVTETWVLGDVLCRVLLYLQFVCGTVLLWTLTMISLERYRCIVLHPMKSRLTGTHALILVLVIWIAFLLFFIPVALWFTVFEFPYGSIPGHNIKVCTLVFPNVSWRISYVFIVLTLILTCLLPIIWLVFNYYAIFRKLMANEQRWKQLSVRSRFSSLSSAENLAAFEEFRHRKHYRTVKILLLDVCITILMWSPIIIMMALIHFDSSKDSHFIIHSCHFIGTLFAALANTCVNPLLYGFCNTHFRKCLGEMWKSCCLRSWTLAFPNTNPTVPITPPSSLQTTSFTLDESSPGCCPKPASTSTPPRTPETVPQQTGGNVTFSETKPPSKSKRFKSVKKHWSNVTSGIRTKIARVF